MQPLMNLISGANVDFRAAIDLLREKKLSAMHLQDFLLTWDMPLERIEAILETANLLRWMRGEGFSPRAFDSGLAISVFRDNSTRTRFSFQAAANLLGLEVADLDEQKSQIAHGETVRETATMISFMAEVIGIRDDMYLGEGNSYMREVAAALQDSFDHGVLPTRPSVVNLQCDLDHPTQTLADCLHLVRHFGGLDKLKGKKIAMTWAYSPSYGKPLSVAQGVIGLFTRLGMDVVLAHPEGYNVLPEIEAMAGRQAQEAGGSFARVESMDEAFQDADIVYPKSWAPYQVMRARTPLLKAGDTAALKDLESACLAQNKTHMDWECDERRMAMTRDGKGLYLHCLPADISGVSCERGEVAESVFERYRLATYAEASFKPYVISAMMLLGRHPEAAEALAGFVDERPRRR